MAIAAIGEIVIITGNRNNHMFHLGEEVVVHEYYRSNPRGLTTHYVSVHDGLRWYVDIRDTRPKVPQEAIQLSVCPQCQGELQATGIAELPHECTQCLTLYTDYGVPLENRLAV